MTCAGTNSLYWLQIIVTACNRLSLIRCPLSLHATLGKWHHWCYQQWQYSENAQLHYTLTVTLNDHISDTACSTQMDLNHGSAFASAACSDRLEKSEIFLPARPDIMKRCEGKGIESTVAECATVSVAAAWNFRQSIVESGWNVMGHGDAREGKWRGKLANGVGSQYPSHYLRTRCIQHYYCWCAHLGCQ